MFGARGWRGVRGVHVLNIVCADVSVVLFFFFQAEDGIRDYKVTGVQTCALPIFFAAPNSVPRLSQGWASGSAPRKPRVKPPKSSWMWPTSFWVGMPASLTSTDRKSVV